MNQFSIKSQSFLFFAINRNRLCLHKNRKLVCCGKIITLFIQRKSSVHWRFMWVFTAEISMIWVACLLQTQIIKFTGSTSLIWSISLLAFIQSLLFIFFSCLLDILFIGILIWKAHFVWFFFWIICFFFYFFTSSSSSCCFLF